MADQFFDRWSPKMFEDEAKICELHDNYYPQEATHFRQCRD